MRIITIANQKGGCGKTTTAVHLAHGLALLNHRVLLIDLDPQGHAAVSLGLPQEPGVYKYLVSDRPDSEIIRSARLGLDLLPGDSQTAFVQLLWAAQSRPINELNNYLHGCKTSYDYIVIDTSPSIGGMQERALFTADFNIITTACDFLSASSVANTFDTINRIQAPGKAFVLPTFYDRRTKETKAIMNELQIYGSLLLNPIYRATILRESSALGKTIFEWASDSQSARDYISLTRRIDKSK